MEISSALFSNPSVAGFAGSLVNQFELQDALAAFENLRNGKHDHPIVQVTTFEAASVYHTCESMGINTDAALKNCVQNVVNNIKTKDAKAGEEAQAKFDAFFAKKEADNKATAAQLAADKAKADADAAKAAADAAKLKADADAKAKADAEKTKTDQSAAETAKAKADALLKQAEELKKKAEADKAAADAAAKKLADEKAKGNTGTDTKKDDAQKTDEKYVAPTTHGGALSLFSKFNDAAVKELKKNPNPVEEEQDMVFVILYWVLFVLMWGIMYVPDGWDIAVFVLYAMNDFGSAWELFPQDELTPWGYYAMGTLAFAVGHAGYVTACLVMTVIDMFVSEYQFVGNSSTINDPVWFWVFIAVNLIAILIPLSKLIWIFVEQEQEENGFFRMKTEQGKFNMEMEMYADIAKMAVLVINFVLFLTLPTVAEEVAPKGKPLYPE